MNGNWPTVEEIRRQAAQELRAERLRTAVELEKQRLRERDNRSWLRRALDTRPFTITWKTQ